MSNDASLDRETAAHTTRNIGLAGKLLRQVLADPESLDDLPNEANLFVLPYDDPVTTLRNIAQAMRLCGRGETVYLRRINGPISEEERALVRLSPDIDRTRLVLSVDLTTGTMTFNFIGLESDRRLTWFPIGESLALLVDRTTLEVAGYRVPNALTEHLHDQRGAPRRSTTHNVDYQILDEAAVATFTEDLSRLAA